MRRLVLAITTLLFVGCSAVSSIPAHLQPVKSAIQQSGGPFSASFMGHFRLGVCSPPDGQGRFTFEGFGSGSFIHGATESGAMNGNVFTGCPWTGSAKLQSTRRTQNSITMSLSLERPTLGSNNPCNPGSQRHVMFTISGGTGRFANATGSGTVAFTCHSDGSFTDAWSGTISF